MCFARAFTIIALLSFAVPAIAEKRFSVVDSSRFETIEISAHTFLVQDKAQSFSGLVIESDFLADDDRKELESNFQSLQHHLAQTAAFEIQSIGPGLDPPKADTIRYRTLLKEMGGAVALNEDYVFSKTGKKFVVFFVSQLKDESKALDARNFVEAKLRSATTASAALKAFDVASILLVNIGHAATETGHSHKAAAGAVTTKPDPACLNLGIKNQATIRRAGERFSQLTNQDVINSCGRGVSNIIESTALSFAPGNDLRWNKKIGMSDQSAEDIFMLLPGPVGLLNSADRTLQGVTLLKEHFITWWAANHGAVVRTLYLALEMMPYSPTAAQSAAEMDRLIAKQAKLAANRFQCLRPDVRVKLVCEAATVVAQMAVSGGVSSAMRASVIRARVGRAVGEFVDTSEDVGIAAEASSAKRLASVTSRESVIAAKEGRSAAAIPQKPILVIASRSSRLRELTHHPVVSARDLKDAVTLAEPAAHTFIKDAPTYAFRITSDRFEDIPEAIRSHLGAVDRTTYTAEYLAKNKGSVIAMQMNGDKPDFYIISKETFEKTYNAVPFESVTAKNPKYVLNLRSNVIVEPNPDMIGILKTKPVKMVKMSDVGFSLDKEATIESPWGKQTKPAGSDAYLVYDEANKKYYMVNVDKNGEPISYMRKLTRTETAQKKIDTAAEGKPSGETRRLRDQSFEHQDPTSKAIATKMTDFKYLNRTLQDFTNDENIPQRLRRVVQNAVTGDMTQVQVVKLTQELRNEYLIPQNFDALLKSKNPYRIISRKEKTANSLAGDLAAGKTSDPRKPYVVSSRFTVMVQERPIGARNDLSTLVHELAHVRFNKWFGKNISALSKKHPEFIWRAQDGKYEVDDQFVTYVNERYAHETEFQVYKSADGLHFDQPSPRWATSTNKGQFQIRAEISDHVVNVYKVTDPRLRALRDKSLSEILLSDGMTNELGSQGVPH